MRNEKDHEKELYWKTSHQMTMISLLALCEEEQILIYQPTLLIKMKTPVLPRI